jgi:hypothetical protein
LKITTSQAVGVNHSLPGSVTLQSNTKRQFSIPLQPGKEAMGRTNPVSVEFSWDNKKKGTLTMLDLPPAISLHELLYGHTPEVQFPVTIHNFSNENSFPVEVVVMRRIIRKDCFSANKNLQNRTCYIQQAGFYLPLDPGDYVVKVEALGTTQQSQLGVGKPEGRAFVYEVDLNGDGINEYRMENDSVRITLLRTGARVIEYIVKSKNDNVLFKLWPDKTGGP